MENEYNWINTNISEGQYAGKMTTAWSKVKRSAYYSTPLHSITVLMENSIQLHRLSKITAKPPSITSPQQQQQFVQQEQQNNHVTSCPHNKLFFTSHLWMISANTNVGQ